MRWNIYLLLQDADRSDQRGLRSDALLSDLPSFYVTMIVLLYIPIGMQKFIQPLLLLFFLFASNVEAADYSVFRIREYRTNYFISGVPNTKIQFSFRFQLLRNSKLHLAFTQQMFWELGIAKSSPFSDLNVNPELYYTFNLSEGYRTSLNIGHSHVSNGKRDVESRSVDSIFGEIKTSAGLLGFKSYLIARLSLFFNEDDYNQDITYFKGPLQLIYHIQNFSDAGFFSRVEAYLTLASGGKFAQDFSRGSVALSFRYRLWQYSAAPRLFGQVFHGYGENLAKYNERDSTFRVGLSIGGQ